MRIRSLSGGKPHPSRGGWKKYLASIELRDEARGVKYYGAVNCNYILFPCGLLIENYGYHGCVMMAHIRKRGRVAVRREQLAYAAAVHHAARGLIKSIDRLSKSLSCFYAKHGYVPLRS